MSNRESIIHSYIPARLRQESILHFIPTANKPEFIFMEQNRDYKFSDWLEDARCVTKLLAAG